MTTDATGRRRQRTEPRPRRLAAWLHARPRVAALAAPGAAAAAGWWSSTSARWPSCCSTRSGRATAFTGQGQPVRLVAGCVRADPRQRRLPDDRGPDHRAWPILVTVTDALLAFPIAYYMARVASPRYAPAARGGGPHAAVGVLPGEDLRLADRSSRATGCWPGCWRRSASRDRARTRSFNSWIVFSYLWLPYMILPIYAGLERVPNSLLEARPTSARGPDDVPAGGAAARLPGPRGRLDLHLLADPRRLHRPDLVSDAKFIGNVIYDNSALGNFPVAAAYSMMPIVIMIVYLLIARRLGRVRVAVMVDARWLSRAGSASRLGSPPG